MTEARSPNRYSAPTAAGSPMAGARRRVVVAMSGGVDSAVAAALMQQAGHEVIGITLQLYDNAEATRRAGACCAGRDIHDARRAAEHLGIPHYVLDYEQRFRQAVIETFADSYAKGETPIPCVSCNQEIKFKDLLDTAQDLGADLLATGHYVERRDEPGGPALYRSVDPARDQSYFLFATTPVQLARLAFPLGAMTKPEVRKLASELGLPVATKPDSQDICFVASGSYAQVVGRLRPEAATPGEIVHVDGRVLGRHEGIMHFTVGQRRGLKIAAAEPLFVIGIEPAQARVIVGPRDCLAIESLWLREMNWLGDKPLAASVPPNGLDVHVRIRSAQLPRPGVVFVDAATGNVGVRLPGGELGVARGQACVIYADGSERARVLGGGFIAVTERQPTAVAA